MYSKLGFIGAGNMGGAIIGGAIKSGFLRPENIYISDIDKFKTEALAGQFGINVAQNNIDIINNCDAVVLSVKPHIYGRVLEEIKDSVKKDTLIITIAAGVTLNYVKGFLGDDTKVVRTMPNTPALVGEGMTAITYDKPVDDQDINFVKGLFTSFGLVEVMDESLIDAFSSLVSSSPAFVDMFIEAMADAAVLLGLPRNRSYIMASQAVIGAAKMVKETGKHPGELKDMVCSPAGTTIEGVRILEQKGLRTAVMEAVIASAQKAKGMGDIYK